VAGDRQEKGQPDPIHGELTAAIARSKQEYRNRHNFAAASLAQCANGLLENFGIVEITPTAQGCPGS
jgi:hypothetical protein